MAGRTCKTILAAAVGLVILASVAPTIVLTRMQDIRAIEWGNNANKSLLA